MAHPGRVKIFLCHSSNDKPEVMQIAETLRSQYIDVWYDDWEIDYGDSISEKINEGISKSDYLAVILTPASIKSGWVKSEWTSAHGKEKKLGNIKLLPVLLKSCDAPSLLIDRKYIDLREENFHSGLSELKGWLENKVTGKPVTKLQNGSGIMESENNGSLTVSQPFPEEIPLTSKVLIHQQDSKGRQYGALANDVIGVTIARLLNDFPSAMLDEDSRTLGFPFGQVKTSTNNENVLVWITIQQGSTIQLFDLIQPILAKNVGRIEWIEFESPQNFDIDKIHNNLQQKSISLSSASVREKSLLLNIGCHEIHCSSTGEGTLIRCTIPTWKYCGKIISKESPSFVILSKLIFSDLTIRDYEDNTNSKSDFV